MRLFAFNGMLLSCTYAFQSESTLCRCLNVKELLARNRRDIWTHNHLVRKRTFNHLAKLALLALLALNMLITLLLHVTLNFQSTKVILTFNIFSVFILITLIYMKFYTNLSRRLTKYVNEHGLCYGFLIIIIFFYLCQAFKIVWLISQKTFKISLLIGLISVKRLQSTKFQVKCYRCFIKLEFFDFIRKVCDDRISARISKPKQLSVFNILVSFRMEGWKFYKLYIIKLYFFILLNF